MTVMIDWTQLVTITNHGAVMINKMVQQNQLLQTMHFNSVTMLAYFQHRGKYLTMSLVFYMIINYIFKAVFFHQGKSKYKPFQHGFFLPLQILLTNMLFLRFYAFWGDQSCGDMISISRYEKIPAFERTLTTHNISIEVESPQGTYHAINDPNMVEQMNTAQLNTDPETWDDLPEAAVPTNHS